MTTIDVDGEDAGDGLLALVVAVVELLVEAMEREAIRRMESGRLTDEQVERLGGQLQAIEAQVEEIKATAGISTEVDRIRSDLDGLVADALQSVDPENPSAGVAAEPGPATQPRADDGGSRD
ncbi:gas vesicle protein K [Haloarcula salina]|uniref:gas vesicle protein K n=1 Tax=Haloarcula salina TaxID=1429914 RepID=UPI003C6EF964